MLQSCHFRGRAAGARFLDDGCATKLRLSSQSSGSTFPSLRLCYKVVTFEPELREYVFFTTAVLQSCHFRARTSGVRLLHYGCATKLRLSSQSSGRKFPLRRLCYKVATFEPELREYPLQRLCTKLQLSSQNSGSTFPSLRLYYTVATFEPELREHVSFTTAVLQSTFPSRRLCYKVATFEPELREYVSFTTAVLQSCNFQARTRGVRFLYCVCTAKLRLSSHSSGSTFPLLPAGCAN